MFCGHILPHCTHYIDHLDWSSRYCRKVRAADQRGFFLICGRAEGWIASASIEHDETIIFRESARTDMQSTLMDFGYLTILMVV
jgi:hypothetical protein